jgi:hypothetical protein
MARTTSHGFFVWDLGADSFNHAQLAANWDLAETLFSRGAQSIQLINTLTPGGSGPRTPLTSGDLAMTSTTVASFAAQTLIRYDGSAWRAVAGVEVKSDLPTTENYIGRCILLTANASLGKFLAFDLVVNLDAGNVLASWDLVGPTDRIDNGSGPTNIKGSQVAGDFYINNSARGLVMVDRSSGTKYRLYFSNGDLLSEVVT